MFMRTTTSRLLSPTASLDSGSPQPCTGPFSSSGGRPYMTHAWAGRLADRRGGANLGQAKTDDTSWQHCGLLGHIYDAMPQLLSGSSLPVRIPVYTLVMRVKTLVGSGQAGRKTEWRICTTPLAFTPPSLPSGPSIGHLVVGAPLPRVLAAEITHNTVLSARPRAKPFFAKRARSQPYTPRACFGRAHARPPAITPPTGIQRGRRSSALRQQRRHPSRLPAD